jgi:hypothetical protein
MEIEENVEEIMEVDDCLTYQITPKDVNFFHESIKDGEEEEFKEFIAKFPNEKHAFNAQNESAAAIALKLNRLEFYELLIVNGFRLGSNEDIKKIVENFVKCSEPNADFAQICRRFERMLKEVFEIHKKCSIESKHKHLTVLRAKCKLIHSTPEDNQQEFHAKIMQALEELNVIKWIEVLLKIAACSDELKIIFDFNRDSVDGIDPRKHDGVFGTTYPSNCCITIGAKGLLDRETRRKVNGTLAHELCHFVMRMIFNNSCKPYAKDDLVREQEFSEVVEVCEQNKSYDDIVFRAFGDNEGIWHAELIVRVVHLLAVYENNNEKLQECKENFSELFKFYEFKVLPDLISELLKLEAAKEIKEINDICGVSANLEASELSLTVY